MKRLSIHNISKPFRVTVDAPSMVGFNYDGVPPQSISFAGHKNSSNYEGLWKSKINLEASPSDRHPSHSFNELCGLIKAVSQISQVYLELDQVEIRRLCKNVPIIGDSEPLAVEHLTIKKPENNRHPSVVPFLNRLFHMFRPRFIYIRPSFSITDSDKEYREIAELLFKERETTLSYFWQHVLEEVSLQVKYHWKQREWQPVEYTSFKQLSYKGADGREVTEYRIQFKWRE